MNDFDIAIIGAGSAGCALARRLAECADLQIALIEAGPDYGPQGSKSWPTDLVDAHHAPNSHDWGYEQTRARVVGGCSTHNECALVRALPGDYDRWKVPGWTDADLAPAVDYVAQNLPTFVCPYDRLITWQRAFLDTALESGFPLLADVNDQSRVSGVAPFVQNIKDGIRWNAAFAFLDTVRSRVTVIDNVLADRFEIKGNRASVLIGRGSDGDCQIRAKRFVLCAGVYGSPAILLRSGVGPAKQLTKLHIPIHVELPGVGKNLHDHPGVGFIYEPTARALRAVNEESAMKRFYEAQAVLCAPPDLHLVPFQAEDDDGAWTFGITAFHLDPHSRGSVCLTSRDPAEPPSIDIGHLTDPGRHDLSALVEGVRLIHRLTKQSPLADSIKRGPRRFTSDKRLARFVQENVTDYSHPVGTCRLGASPQSGGVTDPSGRVHGLANVLVADASLIPQIPRANTNFTCSVIGARLADFLIS
jgi:choline dehydrogenase-like flavoprotein